MKCVSAHSWVECVDYDPISFDYTTLGLYDRSRCRGYPRAFTRQYNAGFGIDTGYNWGHADCLRDQYNANDYNDKTKMARYRAGQTIYISHPAKNHVADTCTNEFIPSTKLEVKMSSKQGQDIFDVNLQLVGGVHQNGKIDKLEYQRCYNFCDDTDKSHCLTAWTLPDSIPDGLYSFIWIWEFNPKEYYANCFDAIISSDNSFQPTMPISTPALTTPSPVTSTTPSPTTLNQTSSPSPTNSSVSNNSSDNIEYPSISPMPEPTPSSTPSPISSSPSPSSEVISGASSNQSPLALIRSYLMNITGYMNFTGYVNVSQRNRYRSRVRI